MRAFRGGVVRRPSVHESVDTYAAVVNGMVVARTQGNHVRRPVFRCRLHATNINNRCCTVAVSSRVVTCVQSEPSAMRMVVASDGPALGEPDVTLTR